MPNPGDLKLTALTATETVAADDLLYVVNDPGGTPLTRKITLADLLASVLDIGSDANPLRLLGEGASIVLVYTPMGGALYGEDVAETYSLGAFDPIDGSGLTQRFLQGFFKHLYTQTLALTDADGADVVEPIALQANGTLLLGGGRDVLYSPPTTDPHVDGVLWNDSGTLTISAG